MRILGWCVEMETAMGFLERVFPGRSTQPDPRYRQPRSSHDDRHDPIETRIPPVPPPPVRPAPRTDLTHLLGLSLVEPYTREVLREYRLAPPLGAGPVRTLQSYEMGVELAADDYGTVYAIMLHFHGDGGFEPYPGTIPGRGGTIAKRGSLWAALGRPDHSTDPDRHEHRGEVGPADQWRFPTFVMHAQYAVDGEN